MIMTDSKGQTVTLDAGVASAVSQKMLDADGAVFFQRELEYIKARSYDVQYADLPARQLFPVSNEAGPIAETITYRVYDQVGMAKLISNNARDLPRVDVSGKEVTINVRPYGASYGYTIQEIRASQALGRSLDQRRANAARRAHEEALNKIAFYGDADAGLIGFFTHPNIPTGAVAATGVGSTTEWVNKTPDQILFDINDLFADIFETTKMVERGNTLLVPPSQYNYLMNTRLGDATGMSIMTYLIANSAYLSSAADIVPVNELQASENPELSTDAMIAYNRNPEKIQLEIPLEFETLPAQARGLEFEVFTQSRMGGLNVYYPLSAAIATGI